MNSPGAATRRAHSARSYFRAPQPASSAPSRAEVKALHKQRLWTALQGNMAGTASDRLRAHASDFRDIEAPLLIKRAIAAPIAALQARQRKSSAVPMRVFMALQRSGLGRSTFDVEDLAVFACAVHPLKLFSSQMRRSLCQQAQLVTYQPGQVLCAQGEPTRVFHVVLSGAVEAYRPKALATALGESASVATGEAPQQAPQQAQQQQGGVFEVLDKDGNGFIEASEWRQATATLGVLAAESSTVDAIFDVLDKDGSGQIEDDELHAGLLHSSDLLPSLPGMERVGIFREVRI